MIQYLREDEAGNRSHVSWAEWLSDKVQKGRYIQIHSLEHVIIYKMGK